MRTSFQNIASKDLETFRYIRFQLNKILLTDSVLGFFSSPTELDFIDAELSE